MPRIFDVADRGTYLGRVPVLPLPASWPQRVQAALLSALALGHQALTVSRSWAADSPLARVRLAGECDRLRGEVALLREELRIKDVRLARVSPRVRPHFPPAERLAILALRAARGWTAADVAARFLVTPATIYAWMRRLDEGGQAALVRLPTPVNRFPDFVAVVVQQLKAAAPAFGKVRIAEILARAGLHVAPTIVTRLLRRDRPCEPPIPTTSKKTSARTITSKRPNHVWGTDLTVVPTALGLWVPWLPFAMLQRWPFAWWVQLVVDHFTRSVVGFAVFRSQPTTDGVVAVLDRAVAATGAKPPHFVTDQGPQFRVQFRAWCVKRGIRPRFGAIGRYGSIAIVERLIGSTKREGIRAELVPLGFVQFRAALAAYFDWYQHQRPHQGLAGWTPEEKLRGKRRRPRRLEPRARYPIEEATGAKRVTSIEVVIRGVDGANKMPVVSLKTAA